MSAAVFTFPASPRSPAGRDGLGEEAPVVRLPPGPPVLAERKARAADHYRRYGPAVYRRCLRLLKNPEAARDATQDVFVKLVGQADRFDPRTPVLAWLYRVASNHCLNLKRAGRYRGDGAPEGDLELLEAATDVDVPARALARQLLARFDEPTRLVAVGVLVDGMEHEEVGEVLGISRRSVARKLARFLDGARRHAVASGAREEA